MMCQLRFLRQKSISSAAPWCVQRESKEHESRLRIQRDAIDEHTSVVLATTAVRAGSA